MFFKTKNFSKDEMARFLTLQKQCFAIQHDMAKTLEEGMDEITVARELMRQYRAAGAGNFFHLPVALFGARTALPGNWRVGHFFPRDHKLCKGDSVILDAAPIFDGFLVDTSYSFCFGDNPAHDQMMRDLLSERHAILDAVNDGQSFCQIATAVFERAKTKGYESVHEKHPGEVLGHRAGKWRFGGLKGWRYHGFDSATLAWFTLKGKLAEAGLKNQYPLWNRRRTSEHPPTDGLWLVEPHFGKDGVGAKWEEILVIEDGQARWLEDSPPHVRAPLA